MGASHGVEPYYTLNRGATWSPITLPGFPAGVGLTLHITLMRERSLLTVYYRIRSICILLVKGYSKPRMAGAAGQKYLAENLGRLQF